MSHTCHNYRHFNSKEDVSTPSDVSSFHCYLYQPSLLMPTSAPSTEEVAEGKSAILIGMSQWNSNDLVEQIETMGRLEEHQGEAAALLSGRAHACRVEGRAGSSGWDAVFYAESSVCLDTSPP